MVNYLSYSFENAASRFGFGGFRVHAQEILGSRGANHHPAGRTQIELDAVHIFPAHHRQIKDNGPFDIRKVSDGFFFLTWFQIKKKKPSLTFRMSNGPLSLICRWCAGKIWTASSYIWVRPAG